MSGPGGADRARGNGGGGRERVRGDDTVHLYPWDVVGDPDAAGRVAGLGVGTVALAAAYHSVRASTPRHPAHRVVEAHDAALYVPVREEAWSGAPLVPGSGAEWAGGADAFGAARDALRAAGLAVDAWVVLTHSSLLGGRRPDLAVRNAFGDRYRHALCPTAGEVRAYAARVVAEVLALGAPDGLVVEACGPLGFGHQSRHEKTSGADWTPVDEALLSLCLCRACRVALADAGADPDRVASAVRAAVGANAPSVPEALGGLAAPLLAVRGAAVTALRDEVIALARGAGIGRLSFFATHDPWATGPSAHVLGAGSAIDTYIAGCWGPVDEGVRAVRGLRAGLPGGPAETTETAGTEPGAGAAADAGTGARPRVSAYVTVLPPKEARAAELEAEWGGLLAAGADRLHIYHAGLASTARLDAAAWALTLLGR